MFITFFLKDLQPFGCKPLFYERNRVSNLMHPKVHHIGHPTPDFGDTSPKQSFVFQFSSHSRTPLREHSQIHDFSASPKSTLPKHKNALFIGVSEDWYSAKC